MIARCAMCQNARFDARHGDCCSRPCSLCACSLHGTVTILASCWQPCPFRHLSVPHAELRQIEICLSDCLSSPCSLAGMQSVHAIAAKGVSLEGLQGLLTTRSCSTSRVRLFVLSSLSRVTANSSVCRQRDAPGHQCGVKCQLAHD